jgi:hypothetical protein
MRKPREKEQTEMHAQAHEHADENGNPRRQLATQSHGRKRCSVNLMEFPVLGASAVALRNCYSEEAVKNSSVNVDSRRLVRRTDEH